MKNDLSDFSSLDAMKNHPVSGQIDAVFKSVIKEEKIMSKKAEAHAIPSIPEPGELSLEDVGELDIGLSADDELPPQENLSDDGLDLSFDEGESLDLGDAEYSEEESDDQYGDLSLDSEEADDMSLGESDDLSEGGEENLGELDFSEEDDTPDLPEEDNGLSLASLDTGADDLSIGGGDDELSLSEEPQEDEGLSLNFGADEELSLSGAENDLSDDALEKLKEIDAIMEYDASQVHLRPPVQEDEEVDELKVEEEEISLGSDLDQPLVSPDLDLDSIDFGSDSVEEEELVEAPPVVKEEKAKKKKKEAEPVTAAAPARDRDLGNDLKEISGAYSGEMERMQATISNLRGDREELLMKIQKLEEDRLIQSRQTLSIRAELDERKIELTIIRKKLNEEISDLKDRLKLHDEKRLILEEKNRILLQELDKAAQKNKIDVKKVQMREKELEQKLELLKSDAESQIRHRDLKILELKRKIDGMEFDMESISQQEKRSVESRFELEDKLEKAIKTLRTAITVLEDESDRSNALSALKKNIDM